MLMAATSSDQGKRKHMENSTNMVDMSNDALRKIAVSLALFDGHLGAEAAKFCTDHLHEYMAQIMQANHSVEDAIVNAFKMTDRKFEEYAQQNECEAGAVGVYVYYEMDEKTGDNFVYVANVGDCRAILCSNGQCKVLTVDHDVKNADEQKRCGDAINGNLLSNHIGVTRAIGDFILDGRMQPDGQRRNKLEGLSCEPNVVKHRLRKGDEFMIIACDGLWDVISNDNAMKHCRKSLRKHNDVDIAAKSLIKLAQKQSVSKNYVKDEEKTTDNISVMVVGFANKNDNIVPKIKEDFERPPRRLFGRGFRKKKTLNDSQSQ